MSNSRHLGLSSLLICLSFFSVAGTFAAERSGWLELAQGPPLTEEEKKKKEQEKKAPPKAAPSPAPPKAAPPPPPKAEPSPAPKAAPPPPPKAPPPPPPKAAPPPPKADPPPPPKAAPPSAPKSEPPPQPKALAPKAPPPPEQKTPSPAPGKPPAAKPPPPLPRQEGSRTPDGKDVPKAAPPAGQAAPVSPEKAPPGPKTAPGTPPAATSPPNSPGIPPAARTPPVGGPQSPVAGPKRFEDVQKGRQERVEEGGRRVIQEPGNRVIVKQGNRAVIRHDETERFQRRPDAKSERRPDGNVATSYAHPDGTRVITEVDTNGRLVRRYRRSPDGTERNLIDNRRFMRNVGIAVGVGAVGLAILNLPPPRVTLPREKYIVEYDRASDDDLYEALEAPPVERLERTYSLEEIRDNYELRQRMRHIELGNITFEFGAWEVASDQYPKLERLARALLRILRRNPDEVFLIEGHTDAVGSDVDNLSLSDRRASAVADILSETFGVPPENLVTQGYGEQFLKINTQGPEPLNRRVAARRITPLMSER
jgi:outer membrane protein OmpA-like peptidoglycan-associated protein